MLFMLFIAIKFLYQWDYLFPIWMQVRDFNIAEKVEDIGYYSGFIGKIAINILLFRSISLSFIVLESSIFS